MASASSRDGSWKAACIVISGLTAEERDEDSQNSKPIFYCHKYVWSPQKQLGQHGKLLLSFLISFYTFPLWFLTSCAVDSLFLLQFNHIIWHTSHRDLQKLKNTILSGERKKGRMWQVDFETAFLPVLRRTWVEAVALGTYFFVVQKWKLIAEIRDSMNCQAGRRKSCRQWKDGNSKKLALLRAGLYISVQWSPCIGS